MVIVRSNRHYALHYAGVQFWWTLDSFHGPFPQHRCHLRFIYIQKSETCHVYAAVAVWLQIQSIQVLQHNDSSQNLEVVPADCSVRQPNRRGVK